jgi:hypothetical protein
MKYLAMLCTVMTSQTPKAMTVMKIGHPSSIARWMQGNAAGNFHRMAAAHQSRMTDAERAEADLTSEREARGRN